jgi:hypothetical protein
LGNGWVPIFKGFRKLLPLDRPYTKLEAAFCLQLDFDEGKPVSVTGYATLWQWSKDKVRKFLDDMGVEIIYPESTESKQNQRGIITSKKPTDQPTDNRLIDRPIKFIDINMLKKKTDRSTDRKPTDRPDATIDPLNPNPKERKTRARGESQSKEKDEQEKTKYGEYVFLSPAEHLALTEKLGAARLAELIEDVNLYCGRSGKSYKSYRAAILTFDKRDKQKNGDTQAEVKDKNESNRIKAKSEYEYFRKQGKSAEELSKIKASICQKYKLEDFE